MILRCKRLESSDVLQVEACVTWSWPLESSIELLAHVCLESFNFEISGRVGNLDVKRLGWQSVSPSVEATKPLPSHPKQQDSADDQKPR
jgi:hypothetical protein